ncbi:uncharacterized protein QC763_208660 [Podospora pseudopauciseta]|uniref:Fe2OG dioxygenase domain-containing protein n=1 Tax=Podospora pseudopauciseta TaxID=2093780 RepID=A0ABR0HPS2_9PEZI|nr:hypothetical protein QC763_208660 [Podospora pseudopauciseta]
MANKVAKIPVIDLSGENQEQVAKELVEAAIEHGFIYIKNTGKDIPADAVHGAFDMGRKIFKAPLEEKQACAIQKNNRGWSAMQYETLDPSTQRVGDFKESRAFNFGEFINGKADQPMPPTIAAHESQINDFRELCYNLCLKINTLLGIGLQVTPPDFFKNAHLRERGASGTILRFLYYPPHTDTPDANREEDVRAGAHSDYGSMTLLFRLKGQAGLEILTQDGKTWAPVPVVPPGTENDPSPPILLNIGDLLSYWTNGLLRSTVHRVVFPGPGKTSVAGETDTEPRYSIAFFCHPVGTTLLEPVPSERVRNHEGDAQAKQGNPYAERKVLTADEHLHMRLKASYLQLYKDKE